ncbi:MAG: S1 RNA-binding domain-containing protein [Spirochaetes bacterium]|nr:S1 RNA-binding domain-containing protein [Spirochaetota bacterium]
MEDDQNNIQPEENFADLLNESIAGNDFFEPGQAVEAKIVKIAGDLIFLHTGGKSEGYLDAGELKDDTENLTVKEGDIIKAYFVSSQNGEMHFTTKISGGRAGQEMLESAFENSIPIEGYVEKEIKGGYEIKIGSLRAFCPYSQMGLEREAPEKYIGQKASFRITELGEKGRNIVLSNREIVEEERKARIQSLRESLKEGMTVKGIVKSVQDFGAFVDIGGVRALLPVSEISRGRVEDINAVLKAGDEIEAVILKLDWDNEKLSVSMKAALPDPWDEAQKKYQPGGRYIGKIVRLTNFGAFVTLEPGLDGLVHISELGGGKRIKHPAEAVKEGDSLEVVIDKVDAEKKRISLKLFSNMQAKAEETDYKEFMGKKADSSYNPFGNLSGLMKDKTEK